MTAFNHQQFSKWMMEEAMPKAGIESMSDLARRIGITHATVSRWFSGGRQPRYDDLQAIARVLGVGIRTVYEAAGLLPARDAAEIEEILAVWEALSPEDKERLLALGRTLSRMGQSTTE